MSTTTGDVLIPEISDKVLRRFVKFCMRTGPAYLRYAIESDREILTLLTAEQLALVLLELFTNQRQNDYQFYNALVEAREIVSTWAQELYAEHQEALAVHFNDYRSLDDTKLGLSGHTVSALRDVGVRRIVALIEWTSTDVLRTFGLGKMRLREIRNFLRNCGYTLKDDPPIG